MTDAIPTEGYLSGLSHLDVGQLLAAKQFHHRQLVKFASTVPDRLVQSSGNERDQDMRPCSVTSVPYKL